MKVSDCRLGLRVSRSALVNSKSGDGGRIGVIISEPLRTNGRQYTVKVQWERLLRTEEVSVHRLTALPAEQQSPQIQALLQQATA